MKLTTVYKLTNKDGNTYNNCHWEVGTERELPHRQVYQICSSDVFHAYRDPNLGLILNHVHANIPDPVRLFEAQGEVVVDDGTKVGCRYLKITKELSIPSWYLVPEVKEKVYDQIAKNLIHMIIEEALQCSPDDQTLQNLKRENPDDYRSREFYEAFHKVYYDGYWIPLPSCTSAVYYALCWPHGKSPGALPEAISYVGFNSRLRGRLIDLINNSINQVCNQRSKKRDYGPNQ